MASHILDECVTESVSELIQVYREKNLSDVVFNSTGPPESQPFDAQLLLHGPPALTLNNSVFWPQSVFMRLILCYHRLH